MGDKSPKNKAKEQKKKSDDKATAAKKAQDVQSAKSVSKAPKGK